MRHVLIGLVRTTFATACAVMTTGAVGCNTPTISGSMPGPSGSARTLGVSSTQSTAINAATSGELSGDPRSEIVTVANRPNSSTLTVWRLGADSSLESSAMYDLPGGAEAVSIGDIDGDGRADVVVGSSDSDLGRVTVMRNTGAGILHVASTSQTYGSSLLHTVDLNGDGRIDVIAASRSTGAVTVLLGQADGSLHETGAWYIGASPISLAAMDVDGDGSIDVVAQLEGGSSKEGLTVLFGSGTGELLRLGRISTSGSVTLDGIAVPVPKAVTLPPLPVPASVVARGSATGSTLIVGDFDADGRKDLALATADGVAVLLKEPHGDFHASPMYGDGANALASIAFDSGAHRDVAAARITSDGTTASVLANVDGSLHEVAHVTVTDSDNGLMSGDFNGDGFMDLAVTTPSSLTVILNTSAKASQ